MKRVIMLLFLSISLVFSTTLQDMYDNATAGTGFDRIIELESGVTYTGGLEVDGATDGAASLKIIGNGAILDMEGEKLFFGNTGKSFDIKDLAVINGFFHFSGQSAQPNGIVKFVTFYNPISYGVKMEQVGGDKITLERNIVVGATDTGTFNNTGHPTGISFGLDKDFPFDGVKDNFSFEPGTTYADVDGNFVKLWATGWTAPAEWQEAGSAPYNNITEIDPLVDPENGYLVEDGSPAEGYGVQGLSVGIDDNFSSNTSIISDYSLTNYPNPFNPTTTISFDLSSDSNVNLTIFNSTGIEVASLLNGQLNSGVHQINFDAANMVSGVYYYSLTVNNKTILKKMMLLK